MLSKKTILSGREVSGIDLWRNCLFDSYKLVFHRPDLLNI
ncbi:hypothetical protein M123_4735 [Bacteroides fragilis str. 3976T8]|uniref:Uncharacterized protein n=1 Tax=Bacteroides fragilis str. 3976T8 TaxID=1339314 RepID=A0A016CWB0_BACFG|nr:hypothetical protein M123_4940 [Bacteroides fragilis str. 3976T8]EXZ75802.1 hypothetical protein M123_4735 [Bacteroides fragilis str. 3976T8]